MEKKITPETVMKNPKNLFQKIYTIQKYVFDWCKENKPAGKNEHSFVFMFYKAEQIKDCLFPLFHKYLIQWNIEAQPLKVDEVKPISKTNSVNNFITEAKLILTLRDLETGEFTKFYNIGAGKNNSDPSFAVGGFNTYSSRYLFANVFGFSRWEKDVETIHEERSLNQSFVKKTDKPTVQFQI